MTLKRTHLRGMNKIFVERYDLVLLTQPDIDWNSYSLLQVDEIYQDDSIGHNINIIVVKVSLLDREQVSIEFSIKRTYSFKTLSHWIFQSENLVSDNDETANLKRVCRWARHNNHIDSGSSNPAVYDHAMYLTRRQFGPIGMEGV